MAKRIFIKTSSPRNQSILLPSLTLTDTEYVIYRKAIPLSTNNMQLACNFILFELNL